ncbi:MAG: Sec-independent protein translocase protein TatB [Gallionellaceae bacterium]|nr:Sec-independent protein translocase protein TatB [Gallionellaceae bacterium]MDD5364949.1 Sec-independent protein translocase protein TatB [Gallionellaceae bacterium]
MFDIGFSELLLIGVVALIVIGPERLPKVARTVGAWLGRLNRYVSDVKSDIDREMRLDELRKLQDEMKTSAQKYEIMANDTGQEVKREVDQVDKVIQAMAATDGGLSQREYDKDKAEAEAATQAAEMTSPESPALAANETVQADTPAVEPKPQDKPA